MMKTYFVCLMWAEYHNLNSQSSTRVFDTRAEADEFASDSYLNKVVEVESVKAANELVSAFNDMCSADWTPNQSSEDREVNSTIARQARAVIEQYA